MFNPRNIEINKLGIQQLIHESCLKINSDIRDELMKSIIVSGGSTCIKNFNSYPSDQNTDVPRVP